jgi:hypothetical protein
MKKLKKADKNLKEIFSDLKRDILEKNDEDTILPGLANKVKEAKLE